MKKKVIHVITDKNIGGAGRWLLNYLTYYDRNKFDMVVALPEDSTLISLIKEQQVRIYPIKGMKESSLDVGSLKTLIRFMKEEQVDVLHTHASLTARIAGKMIGVKKVIHTKHCMDAPSDNHIKNTLKKWMNETLSHKIIAISMAVKEELLALGIKEKHIALIYNGIQPLNRYKEETVVAIKKQYGIPLDNYVVGQIGRLETVKGPEYFIDAASYVLEERKDITFVLVGTGSLEQKLKDMVKERDIQDHIIFTGYIKQVEGIINALDINVMASRSEALCLSIIEGMSIGVPAVGTNAGGIREVIIQGETGELVEVGDAPSLARGILKLIKEDDCYTSYSKNGIHLVHDKFLASKMAEEVEKLYREG